MISLFMNSTQSLARQQQLLCIQTMGQIFSCSRQKKVATLNCSNTNKSPFQFYSNDKDETAQIRQMNEIFHRLIKLEPKLSEDWDHDRPLKDNFRWKMGYIDTKIQKDRYSPIYNQDVGISQERIMTRSQFEKQWRQRINKIGFSSLGPKKPTSQQVQRCLIFDFLLFKTFVEYCHAKKNKTQDIILEDRAVNPDITRQYRQLLARYFKKPYLNDAYKINCLVHLANKNDVLFLQDLSPEFKDQLKNKLSESHFIKYEVKSECAILLKLQSFKQVRDLKKAIRQNNEDKCTWPERSLLSDLEREFAQKPPAICFVDQYLLISLHLTSSAARSREQTQIIKNLLSEIKVNYKRTGIDKMIIVGGDFNRPLQDNLNLENSQSQLLQTIKNYSFVPKYKISTSKKKRTALQAQMHKTQVQDYNCRDYIIADKELTFEQDQMQAIVALDQYQSIPYSTSQNNIMLLPSEKHPFDHFIISAIVNKK